MEEKLNDKESVILMNDSDEQPYKKEEQLFTVHGKKVLSQYEEVLAINNWLLIQIPSFLFSCAITSFIIITKPEGSFSLIFQVFFLCSIVKILLYATILSGKTSFLPSYNIRFLESFILELCNAIFYFGVYAYFKGIVNAENLWIFAQAMVCIDLLAWLAFSRLQLSTTVRWNLLDHLQLLYICLRLGHSTNTDWNSALFLYRVVFYFLLAFSFLIIFLVLMAFFIAIMLHVHLPANYIPLTVYFSGYVFMLMWSGCVFFYIFKGVEQMFIEKAFDKNKKDAVFSPTCIEAAKYLAAFSIVNLIWMLVGFWGWRIFISRLGADDRDRVYKLQTYVKQMSLNYVLISDTYFQHSNVQPSEEITPLLKRNQKLDKCFICSAAESDVLIKPCGHTGCCQECLSNFMKINPLCPICRKDVNKFYVLSYEEESQQYFAKGRVIEIKEKPK